MTVLPLLPVLLKIRLWRSSFKVTFETSLTNCQLSWAAEIFMHFLGSFRNTSPCSSKGPHSCILKLLRCLFAAFRPFLCGSLGSYGIWGYWLLFCAPQKVRVSRGGCRAFGVGIELNWPVSLPRPPFPASLAKASQTHPQFSPSFPFPAPKFQPVSSPPVNF